MYLYSEFIFIKALLPVLMVDFVLESMYAFSNKFLLYFIYRNFTDFTSRTSIRNVGLSVIGIISSLLVTLG